ncbi:hypothetical protein Clacol_007892 [Clathrus columnatus]|uniref:DUF6534 domain-containing protein n=1 Tax=Clathrus columnatus TaxID=1419009 RepID=A0AAV5AG68_9AGAM|nr:hypothetical protein Clacol_007892 [Clathrus columnatus]
MSISARFNDTLGAILLGDCIHLGIRHHPTNFGYSCIVFLHGIKLRKHYGSGESNLVVSDTLVRGIYANFIWRRDDDTRFSRHLRTRTEGKCFMVDVRNGIRLARKGKLDLEEWLLYTSLATAAVADGCIATFLCWQLYTKKTGFKSTDSIVKTLITFTINTGLVMTLASTAVFISVRIPRPQPPQTLNHDSFNLSTQPNQTTSSTSASSFPQVNGGKSTVIDADAATAGLPSFALDTTTNNNRGSYSMAHVGLDDFDSG